MSRDTRVLVIDPDPLVLNRISNFLGKIGIKSQLAESLPTNGFSPHPDTSIIMVNHGFLARHGTDALKKLGEPLSEPAIIFMVEDHSQVGEVPEIPSYLYDYLLMPPVEKQVQHAVEAVADRRVRYVLEKYYQHYLESEVNRQLNNLADKESLLMHAGRLSSLGQMAAGILHEMKNQLLYVQLAAGSLKQIEPEISGIIIRHGQENPDYEYKGMTAAELAEDIKGLTSSTLMGLDKVERMIKEIKDISRKPRGKNVDFDVNRSVAGTLDFVEKSAGKNVRVIRELQEGLPSIKGDPQKLEQVVLNLVLNACQALDGVKGAEITVKTESVGTDIKISVLDNGPGIPDEILPRIFEPFFTSRKGEDGTGLGLSLSREIAEDFGARLSARNLPGGGAEFALTLPGLSGKA